MRGTSRKTVAFITILVLALGTVVAAQRGFGGFRGVMEGPGVPPRFPSGTFEDGAFTACKLMYSSDRREAGGVGWATDYPFAAINLMTRLSELTKVRVSRDESRDINYWVIRLTDPALFDCPFLMGSDVGTASFSDEEVTRLREYLLKGGFLWVDDFWGDEAWEPWAAQMRRVLPEFSIADVAPGDPIRSTQFTIDEWCRCRASTSGGVVATPASAAPRARTRTFARLPTPGDGLWS